MKSRKLENPINNIKTDLESNFSESFVTRQVYNLFQDLWNRFIILEGGQRVQNPFVAKALQATGLVGAPYA